MKPGQDLNWLSEKKKGNNVPDKPVIFFDGYCILCNSFVDFLLHIDKKDRLQFASLQGNTAHNLLDSKTTKNNDTVILRTGEGGIFIKSEAVLRVIVILGGLWKFVSIFRILPVSFRDRIYDWIAKNRYGWFGKRDACRLPTEGEKHKILE